MYRVIDGCNDSSYATESLKKMDFERLYMVGFIPFYKPVGCTGMASGWWPLKALMTAKSATEFLNHGS